MNKKNRIIGMALGLLVSILILALSEKMIHHFFNVPHTLFELDTVKVTETTTTSNLDVQLMVLLLAHASASFFGGMTVARFTPTEWKKFCLLLGLVLTLFNILNIVMLPHPIWFIIVSNLIYIPFAYLGGRMMQR
jgi:hypothetical protein